jgi:uncharacterized protein YjdB
MPSVRALRRAAPALAALVLAACTDPTGPGLGRACTRELSVRVAPEAQTLRVGESFTPTIALTSCGGRERLSDTIAWRTADAAIASVQAATGRVTAVAPGETTITGRAQEYGVDAPVRVTVVAP